jgi:hypothetical protein
VNDRDQTQIDRDMGSEHDVLIDDDLFDGTEEISAPDLPGKVTYTADGKRYYLPDPVKGHRRPFTRVTTLAKAISDQYMLSQWSDRMVAKGMAMRPDLQALAYGMDLVQEREALQTVANQAKKHVGAEKGADHGNAVHTMCERVDRGEDVPWINDAVHAGVTSYRELMARHKFVAHPAYVERVLYVPEMDVVGRVDVLFEHGRGALIVGDRKSQKTMRFGHLEIAAQLAMYAHATLAWNELIGEWEPAPKMNQKIGAIMHLPAGGDASMYQVDLTEGWKVAQTCLDAYTWRTRKDLVVEWT